MPASVPAASAPFVEEKIVTKIKTMTTDVAAYECGVSIQKFVAAAYANYCYPVGPRGRREWPVKDVKRLRKALCK